MSPDAAQIETVFSRQTRRAGRPSLRMIVAWPLVILGVSTLVGWGLALNLAFHTAVKLLGR
jgi:hypothetical protein